MIRRAAVGFLCAALLAGSGSAQPPPPPPAPATLSPGDAIFVRISGVGGGLPEYREIVDRDGQIELPYLGLLAAAGKSIPALETEMAAAYAEARLGTAPVVRITYVWHFDPAPDRANLNRAEDPRRPVPAAGVPPAAMPAGKPPPAP
jgi:protein involved in polysaccharide export with SLBB domain